MADESSPVVPSQPAAPPDASSVASSDAAAPADASGDWGFLDSIEPDSAAGAEAAAPLPTDAPLEDAGADLIEQPSLKDESQAAPEKTEVKADATATPKPEDDPDLSPEENELVRSRPEAEQPETKRKLKAAKFEDHYKNPDKPAEEVRSYLETASPSRYAALEQTIISKKLSEPDQFARTYFEQNPEGYGKLAIAIFNGAKGYFAKALTGREVDPETITKALDAYEANANQAPVEFTPEEQAEIRDFLSDDLAEKLLARKEPVKSEAKPVEAAPELKPEAKEEKPADKPADAKPEEKPSEAIFSPESNQIWRKAEESVEQFVMAKADKEYGLVVTEEERRLTPEVADAKDEKREVLWYGRTNQLPNFYKGFVDWAKEKPGYAEAIKGLNHFSNKGEESNAIESARKLLPLVDRYVQERLKHPIFARIDARIQRATESANPAEEPETLIDGQQLSQQAVGNNDPWAFLNT